MSESIAEKVRKRLVVQTGLALDKITDQAHLVDDLGLDSLDLVELTMDLENDFEMEIPDEDLERADTVGKLITYIQGRVVIKI